MKMQSRSRGLRELCRLLGYSRQAYYQYFKSLTKQVLQEDLLIGEVLFHRILQPRIGGCKLHEMMGPFMDVHDVTIGRDPFLALLRENNLLLVRKKRKHPLTTDSRHWMRKYPDLIRGISLNRADELWVSDITYLHLSQKKFGYLSLITDAYSRKIIGFFMNNDLSTEGPEMALKMALKGRKGNQPLIHHSDRGSQYCSDIYTNLLKESNIDISMTQSGNPRHNAIAERVNGILKQELLEETYPNIRKAQQATITAIDTYNRIRPHSSVDMMTPEKAHAKTGQITRRWKNAFKPNSYKQKQEVG
jgi:transposase InsO family protein